MSKRLPSITSDIPRDLRNFLDRLRELVSGSGAGRLVTAQDLSDAGVVNVDLSGAISPADTATTGLVATPPAPTNVTASGAINNIIVDWDEPNYKGHAYAEIWRSDTNNIGAAVQVGMTPGSVFTDPVGPGVTKYYWVRYVNINDDTGPYNAVSGTPGTTGAAVAYIIGLLTGQITATQLNTTLTSRIDLIDANASVANSVSARVAAVGTRIDTLQGQVSDLTGTAAYSNTTAYVTSNLVTYNGGLYRALQNTTGNLPTNTTYWDKIGDYTSLGQAVAASANNIETIVTDLTAEISARTSLAAQVNNATTGLAATRATLTNDYYTKAAADTATAAAITALSSSINIGNYVTTSTLTNSYYTGATVDSAITSAKNTLTTNFNNTLSGYTNTATLNTNYYTKTDANSAISTAVSGLVSTTALNSALGSYTTTATLNTNYYTKTDANTAISNATSNLVSTSTLAGYTTTAALQTNYYTKASGTALEAQYTVKVDTNGYISGFGLASTTSGATPTSNFAVRADTFYIANPTGPSVAAAMPFIVRTTATTINGVSVPVGVYITDGFIQNGTITNAKIADATIDNAKIASATITNAKIADATITAAKITDATITSAKIADAAITSAKIGSAAITSAKIANSIQSDNYSAGSAGWIINKTGTAEFENAIVRGTIYGTAGTFSGSITGATGNFSGTLSGANITGATGSFTGILQAGTIDVSQLVGSTSTYVSSGTYYPTCPAGFTKMRVTLVGGGGGGGSYYGGGGGGGGITVSTFDVTPGTTFTVVVGAGGGAGSGGGTTYVSGYASAGGGTAGSYNSGGSGGSGTTSGSNGGNFYSYQYPGYYDGKSNTTVYYTGYTGGTGGSAGANFGAGGVGGNSELGTNGSNGSNYGGGGGGAIVSRTGGTGGSGYASVEFFNPNGVIIRSDWNTLISALNRQGIQTT